MPQNQYDDADFFAQYSEMRRSKEGLTGAGEWHELKKLLPDFSGRRVIDLGCGFGWHCIYAAEHGASAVLGVDISEKMLHKAREMTTSPVVEYAQSSMEELKLNSRSFDVVISSLAFHYVESFEGICRKVFDALDQGGSFVFSVEHPIFTAQGRQDWFYDQNGEKAHWPVDHYFSEGRRVSSFLGSEVIKYHKTVTTYVSTLIQAGFELHALVEPEPDHSMLDLPGMRDELRRPMMLLIAAGKKGD